MASSQFFPRILLTLLLLTVMTAITSGALTAGAQSTPLTPTESWVVKQIAEGRTANLEHLKTRELSATFLENLLTNTKSLSRPEVSIENAVITDAFSLNSQEIPFHLALRHCHFRGPVSFNQTTFKKGLNIQHSEFLDAFEMNGATVGGTVEARETVFALGAEFITTKTNSYISLMKATFNGRVDFIGAEIGNNLNLIYAKFLSNHETANFETIKVGNDLYLREAIFTGPVKFSGAVVKGNFEASGAEFRSGQYTPRFDDMKFDGGVFSIASFVNSKAPRFSGMEYRRLQISEKDKTPLDLAERGEFGVDVYTQLEDFLTKNGQPEQADKVYIRAKRRERQNLGWLAYIRSLLLDWLVAYGRQPWRAFLYGAFVVAFGCLVFGRRSGMQAQDPKNEWRIYNPFWYSLDLFAPVINLQSANVWMPKQERTLARHWTHLHRILGWILVPIGVAALTGIIK